MYDDNKVFDKIRPYFLIAAIFIATPTLLSLYNGHTGKLLVATQKLDDDPFFYQTVIYIFDHSFWGAKGIIINQPMKSKSPEKFGIHFKNAHLHNGGPVAFPSLKTVALTRPKQSSRWKTQPLTVVDYKGFDKIYPSYANDNADLDIFIGYSGWSIGQLENEIKNGVWTVLDCDISKLHQNIQNSELWKTLSKNDKKNVCP